MPAISEATMIEIHREELASQPLEVQELYESLISDGRPPQFAIMLATQSAPQMKGGDRSFCEGNRSKMGRMAPVNKDKILEIGRKAGVTNIANKYHVSGLGPPSDPRAWVTSMDDAIDTAKHKNLEVDGAFKTVAKPVEPKKVKMAPDIMDRYVKKIVQAEPKTRERLKKDPKHLREVQERVLDKHARR